jgi:hypothetical protein
MAFEAASSCLSQEKEGLGQAVFKMVMNSKSFSL